MNLSQPILSILFALQFLAALGQGKAKIDTSMYNLGKQVKQHGYVLKFWEGSTARTRFDVILERINKYSDTVIIMTPGMNGEYHLTDKNNDGYKDFVTNYHGHDIIYLFNSSTNLFQDEPVFVSEIAGIVDSTKNIFYSFYEPMYSNPNNFSILYKYDGYEIEDLYELDLITKGGYAEKEDAIRIELYKLTGKDGNQKKIFIEVVKTNNPGQFNYKMYWKKYYRALLGYR